LSCVAADDNVSENWSNSAWNVTPQREGLSKHQKRIIFTTFLELGNWIIGYLVMTSRA
jgi:hypothetical protein